jgi:hypothetical protein
VDRRDSLALALLVVRVRDERSGMSERDVRAHDLCRRKLAGQQSYALREAQWPKS